MKWKLREVKEDRVEGEEPWNAGKVPVKSNCRKLPSSTERQTPRKISREDRETQPESGQHQVFSMASDRMGPEISQGSSHH